MQIFANGTRVPKGIEVMSDTPLQLDYVLENLSDLANVKNLYEGKTHLILNDGSGLKREYWYIDGQWKLKVDITKLEVESGTWDPIMDAAYGKIDNYPDSYWNRFGNVVYIQGYFQIIGKGSANTTFSISGLPRIPDRNIMFYYFNFIIRVATEVTYIPIECRVKNTTGNISFVFNQPLKLDIRYIAIMNGFYRTE